MTETNLVPKLEKTQVEIISQKTPEKHVHKRPGRGGQEFTYVDVGYVIKTLNEAFGLAWSWEIEDEKLGKSQVWVKGKLTIHYPGYSFCKTAFGGSAVKIDRSGQVIDIADDLKAASADALKKAASMLGIASDIYFPQMDRLEDEK